MCTESIHALQQPARIDPRPVRHRHPWIEPMHLTLLNTLPADAVASCTWLHDGLLALGHQVDLADHPDLDAPAAAALGYALADSWTRSTPDALIALGWVAGVAAQVATRERPTPVLLRLMRPGRSGDPAVTRVERALVRSGATMLAATPSEAEALALLGAPRSRLRVLPDAVDCASISQAGDRPAEIVVASDDAPSDVAAVLEGMAAGRPAVVLDRGVLGDLVADGVTGIVVPRHGDLRAAARALQADPMRCEAMGMAAADRALACFDTSVAVPMLGRLVDEMQPGALVPA